MSCSFNPGIFTILGLDGQVPDKEFLKLLEKYPPAGFLFLANNYSKPDQLNALISKLKSYTGSGAIFAVDQEPGKVQRFRGDFPGSKTPAEYVRENNAEDFRNWCEKTATLLAKAGVNLNFAPVLDLCSFERDYPVLNDRSFGDDFIDVNIFAEILINEHRKKNVLTCGKHFPGLGSAEFDPHKKLSISNEPLKRYQEYHWMPFHNAACSYIDMIMTTHLIAPSLDANNPATYSPKVIDYLKKDIKYQGLVISDDLIMGGAGSVEAIERSALKAIKAGHNLIIISRNVGLQIKVLDSLKNRYEDDEAFRKISDANEKIIKQIQIKIRNFKL